MILCIFHEIETLVQCHTRTPMFTIAYKPIDFYRNTESEGWLCLPVDSCRCHHFRRVTEKKIDNIIVAVKFQNRNKNVNERDCRAYEKWSSLKLWTCF